MQTRPWKLTARQLVQGHPVRQQRLRRGRQAGWRIPDPPSIGLYNGAVSARNARVMTYMTQRGTSILLRWRFDGHHQCCTFREPAAVKAIAAKHYIESRHHQVTSCAT